MKKEKTENNIVAQIKKTTEELLEKLKVTGEILVEEEKDEEGINYKVNIKTEETGLVIGYHGETLNGLQLLLGVILYKKLGEWVHILVDVGDYRKMREEQVKEMVGRIAQEVESTNQPVTLPYLSPLERRIAHMMLSENKKVVSESIGEGRDRRLTIKPR